MSSGNISYIYDATGVKLKKMVSTITTTNYAGNYVYENDALQFFNQPEGYVEPINASDYNQGFNYVYQYKDHLGNIRLSYKNISLTSTPSLQIVEENNYYPFGLKHKGYNNVIVGTENNHFTYVGQELNESLDYNMLEMDWRHYDPAIGRFVGIDALAENYYSHTPYHYSKNNPIMYSDPTGLYAEAITTWVHNTETDEMLWVDDGYNFTLDVSNDEFNQIRESGAIESGTSAYNRWFWKAVWEDLTTSDGTISDDVTQFMITDEVEDGLEMIDGVSDGQYLTAGLTLMLRKVQKAKKGYNLIKKLFKHGKKSKLPTPDLNPDQFKKVGDKLVHKKTGAIYSKSKTSHRNIDNAGDQWKAWPKGTTDFGSTSKKTGTRVSIDGDGNVIGN